MKLIRTILLLPLKLVFGVFWLILVILNVLVKLLSRLGNFILGTILMLLAFMFIGYFVLVTPGQISTDARHILVSMVVFVIISTVLALIPSVLDEMIGFCNRVLHV